MSIAGTAIEWFLNGCTSLDCFAWVKSVIKTVIYHSGSLAFGSFLITLIQIPRAILLYIQKKTKDSENKLAQAILCCCQCFLKCLECCLRILTKNTYVLVYLNSVDFCGAGGKTIELLTSNAFQFGSMNVILYAVLFLGRLLISSGSAAFTAYFVYTGSSPVPFFRNLNAEALTDETFETPIIPVVLPYRYIPIAISFILAYYVSKSFFGILEMATTSLMVCHAAREDPDRVVSDAFEYSNSNMDVEMTFREAQNSLSRRRK